MVNPNDWNGWVWPVPRWLGRLPTISDHFSAVATRGHRQHLGADITFRKVPGDPIGKIPHDATPQFISPLGTPIVAAGPGKIWTIKQTELGLSVQIDHGNVGSAGGVNSFYQHLDSFSRPWRKGDSVYAGDQLGTMGYSPSDPEGFRHLHFELWFPTRKAVRDPAPYMRNWRKITLSPGVS